MKLSKSQRIALLVAAATIALSAFAPPWKYVDETPARPAGFRWLWSPPGKSLCRSAPSAEDLTYVKEHPETTAQFSKYFGCNPDETEDRVAELSWPTIALEWAAVLLVGGLTVAGLQRGTRKKASGEPPHALDSTETLHPQRDVSANRTPTQQTDASIGPILTGQSAEQQPMRANVSEAAGLQPVNPSRLPPPPGEKRHSSLSIGRCLAAAFLGLVPIIPLLGMFFYCTLSPVGRRTMKVIWNFMCLWVFITVITSAVQQQLFRPDRLADQSDRDTNIVAALGEPVKPNIFDKIANAGEAKEKEFLDNVSPAGKFRAQKSLLSDDNNALLGEGAKDPETWSDAVLFGPMPGDREQVVKFAVHILGIAVLGICFALIGFGIRSAFRATVKVCRS
jgi:hypothetical protein